MRFVETYAAPGTVPTGLHVMVRAVCARKTFSAFGVAAARTAANHAPAWTASAAMRAIVLVPDVRPALSCLKS